ncbi:MAG: hypothetical protein WKG03_08590, partial [Telluria sp.]
WMGFVHLDKAAMASNKSMILGDIFTSSWMTLATPQALIGAVAGAAMIFAAMRIRRWKDEG